MASVHKTPTFAIIDTETTGGNPAKDRVMEIAIILHNGKRVIEQYSTLVNPGVPIAPFIVALTGISDDMVADAPTFEDIADKVFELTDGRVFVAHNVRFDYGVVRNEFRRLGIRFQRKQLCTVKLSRKILPGMPSYSLGKLCRHINIPLDGRHRAFGDAEATAQLFEKLMFNDRKELIYKMLEEELESTTIPPNLDKGTVYDLPEETGVYYFLDHKGQPIYIGKSKNIRNRVISHFNNDLEQQKYLKLKEQIYDISYEITGSELIAYLMESDEIKRYMPDFNFAQRRRKYRVGLFSYLDDYGYMNIKVDSLKLEKKAHAQFTLQRSARAALNKMVEQYGLEPALCGLAEKNGQQFGPPGHYNNRVKKALKRYEYKHTNFFIISEGRSHHEQSVIWVEEGQYRGFGYFEAEYIENDLESLKESVKPFRDNPDVRRIIQSWMRKKNKDELIVY